MLTALSSTHNRSTSFSLLIWLGIDQGLEKLPLLPHKENRLNRDVPWLFKSQKLKLKLIKTISIHAFTGHAGLAFHAFVRSFKNGGQRRSALWV
jgi:hypothetical protein